MSTSPAMPTEVEPKPWQTGLAPVYIGTFLWIAYFDQLGRRSLPIGGLAWSMLGVAVAGPLAYLLLFRPSGLWGNRVGKPLDVVSTATFGVGGSKFLPGLMLALAQVVLFAVAVGYAAEMIFQGLVHLGLIDPAFLRPVRLGRGTLKSPLYLTVALAWALMTSLSSMRFTRWIGYLMQYWPIFPAMALGGAMLAMLLGLQSFLPSGVDPLRPSVLIPEGEARLRAFLLTLQWTFAFSSLGGILAADWGSGSVGVRDVKLGGWVGVALAPVIVGALALISVAGYQGSKEAVRLDGGIGPARSTILDLGPVGLAPASGPVAGLDAPPFTFRAVANGGFGRGVGGVILVLFGLASLAPAVYSSFSFGLQLKALGPGVSRLTWTLLGTGAAWLLIAGGWFERTEDVFNLLGAVFAPMAGAVAADYRRQRGRWPGPREGVNPAGVIAWVVGFCVGVAPSVAAWIGSDRLDWFQPASLLAFVAAYLTYEVVALVGLESAASPHGWAIAD